MLPALPVLANRGDLPAGSDTKSFIQIGDIVPILVRKSISSVWIDIDDIAIRAAEVFDEADGIYSFFHVPSASSLASVASFMTRQQAKRRPAHFFAIPDDLVGELELAVSETNVEESKCGPLSDMHRHVDIGPEKREALFAAIRERSLYNFRVDAGSIREMVQLLTDCGCLDYSQGPCNCTTPH